MHRCSTKSVGSMQESLDLYLWKGRVGFVGLATVNPFRLNWAFGTSIGVTCLDLECVTPLCRSLQLLTSSVNPIANLLNGVGVLTHPNPLGIRDNIVDEFD